MENCKINLRTLFTLPYEDDRIPYWVNSANCIYKITNLINDKVYIGQAQHFHGRLCTKNKFGHLGSYIIHSKFNLKNVYLYNALRKYKSRNFEVELIESDIDPDELDNREIFWIAYYHSYIYDKHPLGYNMTTGGQNCENMRAKCLELWPETNGMPPECLKAGLEARAKIYGMNGMTPQCYEAGLVRLKELYPDTNGASTNWIIAGNKASCLAKLLAGYDALLKMSAEFRKDGGTKWTKSIYYEYKLPLTPQPLAYRMRDFISRCNKFNLDLSTIMDLFPDSWIPN